MAWFAFRTTFYSLLLVVAILENALMFFTAILGGRVYGLVLLYALITFIIALFTWIWMAVLLSKNKKPRSDDNLATNKAHFWSFIAFTMVWLILGILFSTAIPPTCRHYHLLRYDRFDPLACYMTVGALAGAWLIFLLAAICAISILVFVRRHQIKLVTNIAQFDKESTPLAASIDPQVTQFGP